MLLLIEKSRKLFWWHIPCESTDHSVSEQMGRTNSWVLLAWISRYLDNLDSAISSLNIARIQEILCMIYVHIYHDTYHA